MLALLPKQSLLNFFLHILNECPSFYVEYCQWALLATADSQYETYLRAVSNPDYLSVFEFKA